MALAYRMIEDGVKHRRDRLRLSRVGLTHVQTCSAMQLQCHGSAMAVASLQQHVWRTHRPLMNASINMYMSMHVPVYRYATSGLTCDNIYQNDNT